MAGDKQDDKADNEAEKKELTFEDKIERVASQTFRRLCLTLLLLPLMPVLFVVCIISLANAVKTSDQLLAIEPVNRAGIFASKIDKTKSKIEQQYAEHLVKMDDQSILTVNKKFKVLYDVSRESEVDYGNMLMAYQKAMYQIASQVRGSGEWYFYYDRKLGKIINRQNRREVLMGRYFQE